MLQNLPLLLQQQMQQQQFPTLSNNVNINTSIPLLGMHGVNPGMITIPSCQSHVTDQLNSNIHSSLPQMILTSHGVGPGHYPHNHSSVPANMSSLAQCVGSGSLPMMPLPINVQQTYNTTGNQLQQTFNTTGTQLQQTYSSTGTQLTAMQLQTLQLQQQLLNQLQQVQGMQNLINQFNLQGLASDKQAAVVSGANTATFASNTLANGASETSSLSIAPVSCNSSIQTNSTSQSSTRVSASVSSQCVMSSTNELQMTKSVRVIAAADTTADCNETTETVDIGTETEEADQDQDKDNEQEDGDEKSGSEESPFRSSSCGQDDHDDESVNKIDDRSDLNDSREDIELSDDKEVEDISIVAHSEGFTDLKEYYKPTAVQSTSSSTQVDCISPTPSVNIISTTSKAAATCLAIATWKGNSRSRKQRSSLANSQNLAAELSMPSKGELKLKIKKKHLLSSTITEVFLKSQKKRKEGATAKTQFEKKELRSSTQAATKASSMLAACSGDIKATKTGKEDSSVSGGFDKNDDVLVESIPAEKVHMTSFSEAMSTEELECDSSSNAIESLDSGVTHNNEENAEKHQVELTSRIAAALSCQKGRWLLSSVRNKTDLRGEFPSGAAEPSVLQGFKGSKRSRESNEQDQNNDEGVKSGPTSSTVHSFSTGDLVWGQIRGFPSWPGKLVEMDAKQGLVADEGKLLVKWFGDNTVTLVEPDKLKTLSEGLEAHHRARKKHRRGRKMNSNLEQAIQQAMAELDRQTSDSTSSSPLQTPGISKPVKVKGNK